jgi:two-component system, OmpR family, sensor histidine kinase KdpD
LATDARPDPDRLLENLRREEQRARRGRLRVFFGASAGVGKTYAMLEAARVAKAAGRDVVVGYVEPHGRAETERLLEGLEQLPFLAVRYRGIVRREFDLDAALARRAGITIVDELAHSNLLEGEPPPRHPKRWQDIEELQEAGLDVWTTINVQHLESLNDVVAGITGVRQRETIPDHVLDEAEEIELIDLPPDDLLARLKAGKVYLPDQVGAAVERFFRTPNLIALRELALRRTADRVDAAARAYAEREPVSRPWLARDRFLVGVGPGTQGEELVRFSKRFADALDAEWTVVYVETPRLMRLGDVDRNRRIAVLRLAESLGAETVTLDGAVVAATLIAYARTRNATRIVVGEPRHGGLRRLWRRSVVEELIHHGRGIDVSVIARRGDAPSAADRAPDVEPGSRTWRRYAAAAGISLACTAVAALMDPYFALTNLVMVYLLGTALAGLRLGRGPSVLNAVLNVAAFDFFFVPPRFSFAVTDIQYAVTFAVMLVVALTISNLMASVRQQTRVSGARERRTALLYGMSRELAATRGLSNMARVAVKQVGESFVSQVAVLLPDAEGRLVAGVLPADSPHVYADADLSVAHWVFDHGRAAGLGTDALPGAPALYVPITGTQRTLGVLVLRPENARRVLLPEQRHLLDTFAGQIAIALERAYLAEQAESARVTAETESLRNTLLASISHDLRTPLAVIAGASSALSDSSLSLDEETRRSLIRSIEAKALEMSELISNVLDLVRFETGGVALRLEWESVEDLVAHAVERVQPRLSAYPLTLKLPGDLPAVRVDAALIVQALANILENVTRHTPPGTAIEVSGDAAQDEVELRVSDRGPGLPPGDPERLFAKFQRGREEGNAGGAGLGLAICRAILDAHGGRVWAANRPGGGAMFSLRLPARTPA